MELLISTTSKLKKVRFQNRNRLAQDSGIEYGEKSKVDRHTAQIKRNVLMNVKRWKTTNCYLIIDIPVQCYMY